MHDIIMTIDDLAAYLKPSKATLYKLCEDRDVHGHQIDRQWRFHRAIIEKWLTGLAK